MMTRQRQSGVALITAILLVAIATALATKLAWDNQVSMRRTETVLTQEQARFFAVGAEAIAIDVLRQDEIEFDHLGEDWAQPVPPIEIGIDDIVMGQMQGYLSDAQAKFNLNNLIPARGAEADENARRQFELLIDQLRLEPAIVDAVIDWIDEDTQTQPLGAEDGTYTSLDPPYRPANNYFASVSELRAVAGVDAESYAALLPYVTAIEPGWCGSETGTVPVNLNTAPAIVIQSLHPDITPSQAQGWVEERGETGWESWDQVTDWPPELTALQDREVALRTSCFEVNALVNVGSSVLSMYSLLDRSGGGDEIISRTEHQGW